MWNDDDRKWLYEQMKKNGVNTGSYDDFTKSLDNKEDRDWYYQKSRSLGLNVGSADDFASMMVQPAQKPAAAPAPAKPIQTQVQTQVHPTVNTDVQPKQEEQPQQGWQPTWQEKMGMQMQLDETIRQVKQSQQDFNTRMENIRKGNTLGKTSEVKFNPESGRMERRYYTTTGEEVGSQWEQSRINLAERDRWESTTDEGRRHREKRIQNDFERRVGASLDKYDPDNAAAMAWQQAEERTKADREKHNDEIWSNYAAMGGGREMRMMETGDTWHSNMVDHLNYHDLQHMADDAWNMLGKEKQQSIIEDMYGALKKRYPQATEEQLQQAAKEMAREQSDRRLYELAVSKNAPKSATENFFRKVIGNNTLINILQAIARSSAGTTGDWEARELAEQNYDRNHKLSNILGTVVGFAIDPLTILSAGTGSAAVKSSMWLGGKLFGQAATRKFSTTLAGRLASGVIGGAANFGTFEAGKEAVSQLKWGGHRNEETGNVEDYSLGAIGGQFGHGFAIGGVTGLVHPLLGNVSDKLVKATESTAGKVGIRAAELGVGTIAEGTIFSVPEWIEGSRDAMDVWTDNMAMMAGFKTHHIIKSAPRVISELKSSGKGKAGFETRLRSILDGRGDLALTEDEKKELKAWGYSDLTELTESYERYKDFKNEYDNACPSVTDASRMLEYDGKNKAEFPYNRFIELMNNDNVSQAARAKMYYYLTGRMLPMSTVVSSGVQELKDGNGNITGYNVRSFGARGEVITSRTFDSKNRAEVEVNRINRQAELNTVDVGERFYDSQADYMRMREACEKIAEETGAPINLLFELMKRDKGEMNDVEVEWANRIREYYDELADKHSSSTLRKEINTEFDIDIDNTIRKEPYRRSEKEQKAVEEYVNRLFANARKPQYENSNTSKPASDKTRGLLDYDGKETKDDFTNEYEGIDNDWQSEAYKRGYNATTDEDRREAMLEHRVLGDIDVYNGVMDRINEEADYIVAQHREEYKRIRHKDGSVRPAFLKEKDSEGNEQRVYIVDGHVQLTADGSAIDKEASDKSVVIYNPATGKREQIDPSSSTGLANLLLPTTAEEYEANIQAVRSDYVKSQHDKATGKLNLKPGERVVMPNGEEATITNIYEDGGIFASTDDGRILTSTIDELQRIADEKALADYRQRHGIKEPSETGQPEVGQSEAGQPEAGQPEVVQPEAGKPEQNGFVAGAPSNYTAGMELTIREEDGSEKQVLVSARVRAVNKNGTIDYVPEENGPFVEYYVPGETGEKDPRRERPETLNEKVVSHTEERTAPAEMPQYSLNDDVYLQTEDGEIHGNVIAEENPDGLITIQSEQPIGGRIVNQFTREQLDGMTGNNAVENPVPAETPAPAPQPEPATSETPSPAETPAPAPQPENGQEANQPLEPMPMVKVRGKMKPDWGKATPARAHAYLYNERGLSRENANAFVENNRKASASELEKLRKKKPEMGTDLDEFEEKTAEWQSKMDEAQRLLDYWNGVREIQNAIQRKENERRAAEEAARHEKAVAQAQSDFEARKKAEEERKAVGNENPMPAITEKWNGAVKIDGHNDEVVLPNGETIKGHYVLHESGASSPSHDPETWQKTDGFPMDANDNSVNDRDYERDNDAQQHTQSIARNYDQRALQNVPVVSKDGVVLSGNGRTMAGQLAARDNTDAAYVNYLKEYAHKFGFTPEQVEGMQHPRVSFVPDEAMPYTAETFAKFNQQDMKSQNKTEQAVKLGKTVGDDVFKRIVRTINGYETLGDFYNDDNASLGAVYDLHRAGVIPQAQLAEMVDGVRGHEKLSAIGREFLENMLIGKAFAANPDVVRMLTSEPFMRKAIITALGEIADNIAIGGRWSLQQELADAVKLCFDARKEGAKQGDIVSIYAKQGVLFADPDQLQTVADFNNAIMLMLADALNDKRVTILKITIQLYNNDARESAAGKTDMFAGGIRSR
ncbi:MAG: hypothetical protein MR641_07725 [Bacteroidales bacterium]|nr:hypothetical protein [Bacteroidales bacterium]